MHVSNSEHEKNVEGHLKGSTLFARNGEKLMKVDVMGISLAPLGHGQNQLPSISYKVGLNVSREIRILMDNMSYRIHNTAY